MLQGRGLLTSLQKRFLSAFARVPDQEHFYPTGGTALGEYLLGHRFSFDLDLFTGEPNLIVPFSRQLESALAQDNIHLSIIRRFSSFTELVADDGTDSLRIDFALDSPFRFYPPDVCEHGVLVNDATDLVVDKLLAFYGRCEARDAVDLYFILKQYSLEDMMRQAAQKDPGFDPYWFAISLQRASEYPDEIKSWPVMMLLPFFPSDLKRSFAEIAAGIMARAGLEHPSKQLE